MSPLRSSAGPAVWTNGDAELLGDDPGEAGLAEAGRAGQQDVVERVAAGRGGRDRDRELLLELVLPDELLQPLRAQRRVELVVGALVRRLDAVDARRADAHRRAPFSAWAIRSSGVSPGAPSSSCSASDGGEAEADEAVPGEQPRVVAARDHDRVVGRRRADLLAQLDDDPLRRPLADPGHRLQPRGVARGDRGEQLARRPAREHGERHLRARPTGRRSASGRGRARPRRRSRRAAARRRARSGGCAASPACRPRACGAASPTRPTAGSRRRRTTTTTWSVRRTATSPVRSAIMPRAPDRRAERAPFAWQIATASASAAWSGRGSSLSPSSVWTIRWTCCLPARPEPQTAPLTCWGV